MIKLLLNWRYYVLAVFSIVALFLLCADVSDELPFGAWAYIIVSSKILSVLLFYIVHRLLRYWGHHNRIPEIINPSDKY